MLMILITLSLAAILVAWAGSSYGAFAGGSQLFFQQRGQALQENFVIEEVFFEKNTTGQIFIFVRNVGVININIAAIYQNGTSITSSTTNFKIFQSSQCDNGAAQTQFPVTIGVTQVCEFTWTPPVSGDAACSGSPWCSGDIFILVVASQRGNQVVTTMRGP
jgi:hypothetical protein